MELRVAVTRASRVDGALKRSEFWFWFAVSSLVVAPMVLPLQAGVAFKRGDANCDGCVNTCDALFLGDYCFTAGPMPCCDDAADADDDGVVCGGIADITYILSFVALGGPPPPAPGPLACGPDPTADALACAAYDPALCDVVCPEDEPCKEFRRGDANCDGCVGAEDAAYIDAFLFTGGCAPCCMDAADANDDDSVTAADAVFILAFLMGGPPPPEPGPDTCGPDVTGGDSLYCTDYTAALCAADCAGPVFKRGDANCDGCVNLCDAAYIAGYSFFGAPTPCCFDAIDVNDDGDIAGVSDFAALITFLAGGPDAPPAPGPLVCGSDPSADGLDCLGYSPPCLCEEVCPEVDPCQLFKRGDADCDGCVSAADAAFIEAFLAGGEAPCCMDAADADDSGAVSKADSAYISAFLCGGKEPPIPGPTECGVDPTLDDLTCTGYTGEVCDMECPPPPVFKRGDANGDGCVDECDAVFIADFNFRGGPAPPCLEAADANDDGSVTGITDTNYLLAFVFLGGPAPPAPGPLACGPDPTPCLGCDSYPAALCAEVCPAIPACYFTFLRGDCDGDGFVGGSVNDPIVYLNWAFGGAEEPSCLAACDADDDHFVGGSVTDAIYYLSWAFLGGPPPPPPFPACGLSDIEDVVVGCETPTCKG